MGTVGGHPEVGRGPSHHLYLHKKSFPPLLHTMNKILPCPFCGNEPKKRIAPAFQKTSGKSRYLADCVHLECGCWGRPSVVRENGEEAMELWNKRVST